MAHLSHLGLLTDSACCVPSVVTNRNDSQWLKQTDKRFKKFLSGAAFPDIVGAICERRILFVWVKRKYIPKEYA
jgi:hypothetical protein